MIIYHTLTKSIDANILFDKQDRKIRKQYKIVYGKSIVVVVVVGGGVVTQLLAIELETLPNTKRKLLHRKLLYITSVLHWQIL